MSGHHPATVRRAGSKSVAQDLRALRLWQSSRQWRAVPWSCIDAEPGCRALRRSSVMLIADERATDYRRGTYSEKRKATTVYDKIR